MQVKLVALTKSMVAEKEMTAEELLVYEARVSNPSNQLNTETSDKLLGFMIKHKHWSPFDMINMTVEVTTSRVVAHQILRHWSIKPQEFSQRYAEAVDVEPIELRKAGTNDRQSSSEAFDPEVTFEFRGNQPKALASELIEESVEYNKALYKALIAAGAAKECARFILPLATSTTMYLNGSIRSWIHYMEQRCDKHAQLEHREVAVLIKAIFMEHFPNISKALELDK